MNSVTQLSRLFALLLVATALAACGPGQSDAPASAESTVDDIQEETAEVVEEMRDQADDAVDAVDAAMDDMEEESDDGAEAAAPVAADDGDACALTITAGDNIAYSTNAMSVPASCESVTVTITHTGSLPAAAMGHNWVLIPADAAEAVGMAGMNAGPAADYVPDDERVVAATKIVGGGESDSVTFALADLADGTDYVYICTFPGHWSIMKGTFAVTG